MAGEWVREHAPEIAEALLREVDKHDLGAKLSGSESLTGKVAAALVVGATIRKDRLFMPRKIRRISTGQGKLAQKRQRAKPRPPRNQSPNPSLDQAHSQHNKSLNTAQP